MVHGQVPVEHFLQVEANVAQAQVQSLQRLQLGGDAGGEGADGDVADVAQEVFDANLLGFFGLDFGRGVDERFRGGGAVLARNEKRMKLVG